MTGAEKILDICRRLDRALQRDWGGTGAGISRKLKSSQYTVPPQLAKRIRYLGRLERGLQRGKKYKHASSEDFLAKGEQIIQELAEARKTASRRLIPWLKELAAKYRLIVGLVVAMLIAVPAFLYLTWEPAPEPVAPPLPRIVAKTPAKVEVKPAPVPASTPAPVAAPAPTPTAPAPKAEAAPAPAPELVAAPVAAPVALPTDTKVFIEAPQAISINLKRAELVKGTMDRDEIVVIVEVQNMGYESLKRITFDAWLYDTSGKKPVAIISPAKDAVDGVPWQAFLRQAIKRGQSAEVRLNYTSGSKWSSDKALALVNSGHYLIHLKVTSLADGQDKTLPL